jgi:hypothetical protein
MVSLVDALKRFSMKEGQIKAKEIVKRGLIEVYRSIEDRLY